MLEKAAHWLTGWIEMEIQGDGARFLNAAAKMGVESGASRGKTGGCWCGEGPGSIGTSGTWPGGAEPIPACASGEGCLFLQPVSKSRKGCSWALVGVGVYVYLSGFCWGVTVTGDQRLTQAQVLQAARENGVYLGCSLYGLDAKRGNGDPK